ncbi:hypothetical protein PVMG_02974 [Plasmodium vivax Mauritania I]|uniref:Uncharacterized protein n=3 Tax=Plasmodium vivax TaxID=5855 RepID=A0A0J9T752_PLAVI|nr:hypothetical protein PVBG_01049 [Plasmodium vivax Brazil I]KMZ90806.1 hypothetical protein PVMG_02974 [Plasmodium vivax Mauritania I]SCO69540.1 conserved Plasmodium protein, unknown function [Plasmodium vivax]
MDDEDRIKNIYLSLKNKNKREWAEMMQHLTKDQKRRLIFYIRKKNKNSLNKINNIKVEKRAEKEIEKVKAKSSSHHRKQILIDYSNVRYDLNLKNYISRILRIYKLQDNFDFVKGLHLYMNILCHVIFKKFSFEYNKRDSKNKNLLIFLRNLFPFEFQNYQDIYNMRWSKDFSASESAPTAASAGGAANWGGASNSGMANATMSDAGAPDGRPRQVHHPWGDENNVNASHLGSQKKATQSDKWANADPLRAHSCSYAGLDGDAQPNGTPASSFECPPPVESPPSGATVNKSGANISAANESAAHPNVLVKTEPEDPDYDRGRANEEETAKPPEVEGHQNEDVKRENPGYQFCRHKDMNQILKNLYDGKRFDYRIRFRSLLSRTLNRSEYERYCDMREKLFKYKKKNFIKWLAQFTNINTLDLYVVNFFIFLFLDRLYLILETYIRLNYNSTVAPASSNEYLFDRVDDFLDFTHLLDSLTDVSPCGGETTQGGVSDTTAGKQDVEVLSEEYDNIVKENPQNFFLSLDLIYDIDIHKFKIKNKVSFERLIRVDISSYINETNIYGLIQFDEKKSASAWKALTRFTLMQNRNLKLPKFNCFSIFLIVRFKYYLDEFKQYANIDYIYKTVEEEYHQVEKYLSDRNNSQGEGGGIHGTPQHCAHDENSAAAARGDPGSDKEFEYSHLIPLYLDLHKELKRVNEYVRFYGNLLSFVNFIEKYANCSPARNIVKIEQGEEKQVDYFDHSFFFTPHLGDSVKRE